MLYIILYFAPNLLHSECAKNTHTDQRPTKPTPSQRQANAKPTNPLHSSTVSELCGRLVLFQLNANQPSTNLAQTPTNKHHQPTPTNQRNLPCVMSWQAGRDARDH